MYCCVSATGIGKMEPGKASSSAVATYALSSTLLSSLSILTVQGRIQHVMVTGGCRALCARKRATLGGLGASPPREISDFRPSLRHFLSLPTAPWRNHHAPCSGATLSREGVAPRGSACSLKSGPVKTGPTGPLATALGCT